MGEHRGRLRSRQRYRSLTAFLLLLVAIVAVAGWIGNREDGSFLTCRTDAVSPRGLTETFQTRPELEPWLDSWRTVEGNAAPAYAEALEVFGAEATAEPATRLARVLPQLERGSRMRRSTFTDTVYPITDDLVSTELVDLPAFSELLGALREDARRLRSEGDLEGTENRLRTGLSIADHLQQEPIGPYLLWGLSEEPELLAELAGLAVLRGNSEEAELYVRRAAWAAKAREQARSAVSVFHSWATSPVGLAKLRRLASASDTPPGLRGEIVGALSYGHTLHGWSLLWGPSSEQEKLLRELQNDPDPVLARLAIAGEKLQRRGLIDRLRWVRTAHSLG